MGFCKRTWNLGEPLRDLFLRLAISGLTKIHHEAFIDMTFLGLTCVPGLDGRARFGLGRKPRETRRQRQGPGNLNRDGFYDGMPVAKNWGELDFEAIGFMSYFVSMTLIASVQFDIYVGSHWWAAKVCHNFLGLLLGCTVPSIPKQSVRNRNRGELRS